MTGQVGDGRLVETRAGVNVDSVEHIIVLLI